MSKISRVKLYEEIGRRIRAIRDAQELTQEEFAKKLGVKRTSITNLEKGTQRATLYLLYSLAQRFDVSLEKLLPPIEDTGILASRSSTDIAQVRTDKETKVVPRQVKSFYEKL